MDIKLIVIVVLVLAVAVLSFMLFINAPKAAEKACMKQINEVVIPEATAKAGAQCAALVQQCATTLEQLKLVPACAAALTPQ